MLQCVFTNIRVSIIMLSKMQIGSALTCQYSYCRRGLKHKACHRSFISQQIFFLQHVRSCYIIGKLEVHCNKQCFSFQQLLSHLKKTIFTLWNITAHGKQRMRSDFFSVKAENVTHNTAFRTHCHIRKCSETLTIKKLCTFWNVKLTMDI